MIKSDTLFVHVNIEYCLKRIINFIEVGIIYISACVNLQNKFIIYSAHAISKNPIIKSSRCNSISINRELVSFFGTFTFILCLYVGDSIKLTI